MRVAVEDPGEHLPLALVVVQVDGFAGDVLRLGLGLGSVGVLRLVRRRILVQRDVAPEPGLADFGVGVPGSRGRPPAVPAVSVAATVPVGLWAWRPSAFAAGSRWDRDPSRACGRRWPRCGRPHLSSWARPAASGAGVLGGDLT